MFGGLQLSIAPALSVFMYFLNQNLVLVDEYHVEC